MHCKMKENRWDCVSLGNLHYRLQWLMPWQKENANSAVILTNDGIANIFPLDI